VTKRKLIKFAQVSSFRNVIQPNCQYPPKDFHMKGKWAESFFENQKPLVLEIGCGKGDYTTGLAQQCPEKNFMGIDIKGDRLWVGASKALEQKMTNVGFLRISVERGAHYFAANEVEQIWITFPDPQPNKPREKKRLTSQRFLNVYRQFLKPDGIIHLKTDNVPFFDYTLETIASLGHKLHVATHDLYGPDGAHIDPQVKSIQTYYEGMFLEQGMNICYLNFSLKP
jgi:tRNA (guanine-N7-)-methyltransferase